MKTEGPWGFYRGLLPSLMGVSHVAVQFPLYENFKIWARNSPFLMSPSGTSSDNREISPKVILICSSTAKMIASVLTYPHEVVRTRLQMQPRTNKALQSQSELRLQGSIAPPYKHPSSRLQGTIESKRSINMQARRRAGSVVSAGASEVLPPRQATLFSSSRFAASEQKNPSLKYSGVFRTVQTIFAEEGIRGFYNGMGVNLIRTVPSSALTILT